MWILVMDQEGIFGVSGGIHKNVASFSVPYIREKKRNEIKVIEVTSGEDVKLTCQIRTVGQTSKPRYYWLKDNQTLSPSSHQRLRLKLYRYLKIKRAKKEDTGFYTCVAVNECGKNPFTMHLVVGSK